MSNLADNGTPEWYRGEALRVRGAIEMISSPSVRDKLEGVARLYEGMAQKEEMRRTLGE